MMSQQLAQAGQLPAYLHGSQDPDTLFHALSRLSLRDQSTQHVNIEGAAKEATVPLPLSDNAVFAHSSYFTNNKGQTSLPGPAIIRDHATFLSSGLQANTQGITHVPIPSRRLLVKYGAKVSTVEAACLVQLRSLLGARVPVPEVFGWSRDGNEAFIYMDLPQGATLAVGWPFLSDDQKMEICGQLRDMVAAWRGLEQDGVQAILSQGWVGSPAHRALQTPMFAAPSDSFGPEMPVMFTHGNLHPANIVISTGTAHPRVVAVLDWSQAGWYPAYWEKCKARKAARSAESTVLTGWEDTYLSRILDP